MAWYPEAKRLPINPGPNDPPIKVIGAILHVDAGNSNSLYDYFKNKSGGIESHFFVKSDGSIEQYRDTGIEADANLKANSFIDAQGRRVGFVSIETQGFDKGEWNAAQLAAIKRLLKWLAETHDFPLAVCKSSTSPGVGYHTMWGAPGPWTPVAKDCPGPDRIRQFVNVLTPWFRVGAPSGVIPTPIGDSKLDMDEVKLREILADELNKQDADLWANTRGTGKKLVIDRLARIEAAVADIQKKVNG